MTTNDCSICQCVKTMLTIFRFFLFLTVLNNTQGAPKSSFKNIEYPWVVGASRCSIKDYPFVVDSYPRKQVGHFCKRWLQVSIRRFRSLEHICSGTLILPSWVLTSSNCLSEYTKENVYVTAGSECLTRKLNKTDLRNSARVANIVVHPNPEVHNIALIQVHRSSIPLSLVLYFIFQLQKRLQQSSTVGYAKLANYLTSLDDFSFAKCVNTTILGWGYGLNSSQQAVNMRYINEPQCLHCISFSFTTRCADRLIDPESKTEVCSDPNQTEYCQVGFFDNVRSLFELL